MTGIDVDALTEQVAELLLADYASQYDASHLTWRDFNDPARPIVELVAARVEQDVRQRQRADVLDLHLVMETAIIRGGYRDGEEKRVGDLLLRLARGGSDA